MKLDNSPTTQHCYAGHSFFLKRDDLLHPEFSGNKARKLMNLLQGSNPDITTIIGYGSAQANSLYSIAALAKLKGWQCEFYVDRIPNWLKQTPRGNYRAALALGAQVRAVSECGSNLHPNDYIHKIRQPDASCLLIPEGGRSPIAEAGVAQLATEILAWQAKQACSDLVVALPSGTGTTALYLHKYLKPHGIDVLTCACVGGEDYLRQQFSELGETHFPTLLTPERKHHFGKLYAQDYQIWQDLRTQTGVEFDLLYDPLMWQTLLPWLEQHPNKTLLYIHQGGLLGNETMLPRYQRKYDLK